MIIDWYVRVRKDGARVWKGGACIRQNAVCFRKDGVRVGVRRSGVRVRIRKDRTPFHTTLALCTSPLAPLNSS